MTAMSLAGTESRGDTSGASAIDLVKLRRLMDRSEGHVDVRVALIDGPVALDHPGLSRANIEGVSRASLESCEHAGSDACLHGTLVAGVLVGSRDSGAPGISPMCTLLVRPIFFETASAPRLAQTTLEEVAAAVVESVDAGAHVINISASLAEPSCRNERCVDDALAYASRHGTLVIVAAGNQQAIGSSAMTRHAWTVPVVACAADGKPTADSNLSRSIGRWGLLAPGANVNSLAAGGGVRPFSGTSAAAPFVTGAAALLMSLFPRTAPHGIRSAILAGTARGAALVPPLLDADAAFGILSARSSVAS
jgi:subtilisin family serine protease